MSTAKIVAKLVAAGHEDLAEELLSTAALSPQMKKLQKATMKFHDLLHKAIIDGRKFSSMAQQAGLREISDLCMHPLRKMTEALEDWPDDAYIANVAERVGEASAKLSSFPSNKAGVLKAVKSFMDMQSVYVVADVEYTYKDEGSTPEKTRVSGSILRMSSWLEDLAKNHKDVSYRIVALTSDRNAARKQGEEV